MFTDTRCEDIHRAWLEAAAVVLLAIVLGMGMGVTAHATITETTAMCEYDMCDTFRGVGECRWTAGTIARNCDMVGPEACVDNLCPFAGGGTPGELPPRE